jgi:hypothetical protein
MEETTTCQAGINALVIPSEIFSRLYEAKIGKFVEKRGNSGGSFRASYLSWAHAYRLIKEELPSVMVDFEKAPDGGIVHTHQYGSGEATASVRPFLTDGVGRTTCIQFPIMDNRFGAIENPDAREISDACQRGAVKAIAVFTGLGLPLYCGEDIPSDDSQTTTKPDKDDVFEQTKETNDVRDKDPVRSAIPDSARLYLNVPFKEKDAAKEKGARWDTEQKKWYATSENFDQLKDYAEGLKPATAIKVPKEKKTKADKAVEEQKLEEGGIAKAEAEPDPDLEEDVPF